MTLEVKSWNELSRKEINDIFSLRSEVFIVEQECAYQDVDGKDKQADHIMLHVDNELVGYTRVFPENTYFKEASFGRAVVKKNHRQKINKPQRKRFFSSSAFLFSGWLLHFACVAFLFSFCGFSFFCFGWVF